MLCYAMPCYAMLCYALLGQAQQFELYSPDCCSAYQVHVLGLLCEALFLVVNEQLPLMISAR